jgi:hypothetical protein
MTSAVQFVFEMAARALNFCLAYPSTDPGYPIIVTRLQETIARGQAMSARQHNGLAGARGAREQRNELKRSLQQDLVRYLIAVGGVVAKERTDLAAKFRLPRLHVSNQVFLVTVKALLADAESQRDLLVKEGMSPTLFDDLSKSVADLEAASEATRNARRDHIGASADLELIAKDLLELVRVLDGVNRWRFRADPEKKAEWDGVKAMPVRIRAVKPPASQGPTASAA